MAIIFDCLHILGILFSMKHVLSIVCNHLCALGPRFFSCSTSMSSMPVALLFLSAAIPFIYSSSLNADTNDGFPSTVGSAGHLGFVGIVPWPLTSRWCATWLELTTRHGGFGEVGSLDSFLIVCHALRLLSQINRCDDLFPSLLLFFFHCVYQLVSSLQGSFGKRVA